MALSTRPEWVPDKDVTACDSCFSEFSFTLRRHHCRACGKIFCWKCSDYRITLPESMGYGESPVRVCINCFNNINANSRTEEEAVRLVQFFIRNFDVYDFKSSLTSSFFRQSPEKAALLMNLKEDAAATDHLVLMLGTNDAILEGMVNSSLSSLLQSIKHPNILPAKRVDVLAEKSRILLCRPFMSKGSLKDGIYRAVPANSYESKYGKQGKPLRHKCIEKYARQIISALLYLRTVGLFFPYLSTGNVVIKSDGNCALVDIENACFGFQPQALFTYDNLEREVEAFANTLYEMAFGAPRLDPGLEDVDNMAANELLTLPRSCPKEIYKVLKCIFDSSSTANPVTLNELAKFPLLHVEDEALNPPPKLKKGVKRLLEVSREVTAKKISKRTDLAREKLRKRRLKEEKNRKELAAVTSEASYDVSPRAVPQGRPSRKLRRARSREKAAKRRVASTSPVRKSRPTSTREAICSSSAISSTSDLETTAKPTLRKTVSGPVLAPPPPPPPAAERLPPAPKSQPTLKEKAPAESRGALLASIRGFNSAKLKSVDANDRSDPKLQIGGGKNAANPASSGGMSDLAAAIAARMSAKKMLE